MGKEISKTSISSILVLWNVQTILVTKNTSLVVIENQNTIERIKFSSVLGELV